MITKRGDGQGRGAGRVVYGIAPAVALRGVGVGAMGLGACIVGGVLLAAVDPLRAVALPLAVVLGVLGLVTLVILVVGLLRVAGRGPRLVLDEDGYTNATGPGGGVRRAAWRDVRTVRADGPVVVVDLAGGRRSLVRTGSLDVPPDELARQLRHRLDKGHGYRRLTG